MYVLIVDSVYKRDSCLQDILNITSNKLDELIKPLTGVDYEDMLKDKCYLDSGSPDSTEEMKNLESRQAAVTLLQIKNYGPMKYLIKHEEDNRIVFNSVPSLPTAEHCNAYIDVISEAVAQRESEEARSRTQTYVDTVNAAQEFNDELQRSPAVGEHGADNKEIDLSLYGNVKEEPLDNQKYDDGSTYAHRAGHKPQISVRHFNRTKASKEYSNAGYEECSQSSSDTDPDRLQMDISQMSQVNCFIYFNISASRQ